MGSLAQALNGGFRAGVMIFAFVYVLLLTLIPVVLYFTTHYVRPVAVHGREMVEVLDRIDANLRAAVNRAPAPAAAPLASLPAKEFAKNRNLNLDKVLAALRTGKLKGRQVNGTWYVAGAAPVAER
jgi:hypothetical protein